MMKRFTLAAVLLLATLGTSVLQAGTPTAQARELMETSGMSAQIDEIPVMIGMTLQQQQAKLQMEDWQLQTLSDALQSGFDPQPIKAAVRDHLETNLEAEHARQALVWLDSPLGQRATDLEAQAGNPAVQQRVMQRLQSGAASDASGERQALIERFDEATRASDMSLEMVMGLQRGLLTTVLGAAGAPPEQVDAAMGQISAQRSQLASVVESRNRAMFEVIYSDLSEAEFGQYVEFAESEAGQAYHQAMFEGFAKAMESAATRSGEAIAASTR